jgi:hypothetical protein
MYMSDEETPGDNNDEQPDIYSNMFTQVQYIFTYGLPHSFQNVLKRDANLSGDAEQDVYILSGNFVDFLVQMGYDPEYLKKVMNEQLTGLIDFENEVETDPDRPKQPWELGDEDYDDSEEVFGDELPSTNTTNPQRQHSSVIKIGEKAYEDIDDMVADDAYFNRFIEQFNKEENLLFRKIVFRAFLKDTLYPVDRS